jgi:predicted transposase/invertase (TIGR01784 family)
MKFVDIKNDVAFRKIFGNQKKTVCLISFLNAVLRLEGNNRIVKVTIINPYLLPRIKGEKGPIIDVRATDQKNRQFIVEMQVADKKGFENRVQYYAARDYSMQIESGEDYAKLKPTFFVGILNYGIGFGKQYLAKHFTVEEETGACVLADIQYHFIQLTKFKKKENELVDILDKWTYFLKHAQKLDMIPEDIEDEGLRVAYKEADKFTWDKEELRAYDNASMRIQDERGEKELAREQGLEEGREQGMQQAKAETVLKPYFKGKSVQNIADFLDMSLETVQQIIDEYEKDKK